MKIETIDFTRNVNCLFKFMHMWKTERDDKRYKKIKKKMFKKINFKLSPCIFTNSKNANTEAMNIINKNKNSLYIRA